MKVIKPLLNIMLFCMYVTDSVIIFWHLSDSNSNIVNIFQEDEEDNKENWTMLKVLRCVL